MPNITIDNRDYDLDTLSDDARAQLQSLQFVDAELARLQAQAATCQTARMAYAYPLRQLFALHDRYASAPEGVINRVDAALNIPNFQMIGMNVLRLAE